jgi:hypothetical protein
MEDAYAVGASRVVPFLCAVVVSVVGAAVVEVVDGVVAVATVVAGATW